MGHPNRGGSSRYGPPVLRALNGILGSLFGVRLKDDGNLSPICSKLRFLPEILSLLSATAPEMPPPQTANPAQPSALAALEPESTLPPQTNSSPSVASGWVNQSSFLAKRVGFFRVAGTGNIRVEVGTEG